MDPIIFGIVMVAGVVRGVSGFGGAMLIAPALSILLTTVTAVVYSLCLESIAAVAVLPFVWRQLEWRTLLLIGLPALAAVPVGGLVLVNLDPDPIRRLLAVIVIGFSLLMLLGLRYEGAPRPGPAAAVGAASGLLFGATSMGGPPVILYLLSGSSRHDTTRANLMAFISAASAAALVVPWQAGEIAAGTLETVAVLAPGYLLGIWAGGRLFPLIDERLFRRLTLLFMLGISGVALFS